jgi:hypothetical protein
MIDPNPKMRYSKMDYVIRDLTTISKNYLTQMPAYTIPAPPQYTLDDLLCLNVLNPACAALALLERPAILSPQSPQLLNQVRPELVRLADLVTPLQVYGS